MRVLRLFLKLVFYLLAAVVAVFILGVLWFVYYSRDLPDVNALAQFAPATTAEVSSPCLPSPSVAIPYALIGKNLANALNAAETGENDPGMANEMFGIFSSTLSGHRPALSIRISRTMFCTPSKMAKRQLDELRTAGQLERRFSRRDLFTIYVNRIYFDAEVIGVHNGSQHFFGKNPDQLSVAEAALLAGLIRSPSRFSPYKHPDIALQRRNEILDDMVSGAAIRLDEGQAAKMTDLDVLPIRH